MVENKGFRPFREAARNEADQLTAAMEDYLEMIYRLQQENQTLRVSALAGALQVGRSSVSKMLRKLAAEGFLIVENYGNVQLTEKGRKTGESLAGAASAGSPVFAAGWNSSGTAAGRNRKTGTYEFPGNASMSGFTRRFFRSGCSGRSAVGTFAIESASPAGIHFPDE